MFLVFLVWIALCVGVGAIASSKGRSGIGLFFASVILSPLIGLIIVLCMASREQLVAQGDTVDGYKKCPFCAETVRAEAIKCKHCGSDLPATEKPEAPDAKQFKYDEETGMRVEVRPKATSSYEEVRTDEDYNRVYGIKK